MRHSLLLSPGLIPVQSFTVHPTSTLVESTSVLTYPSVVMVTMVYQKEAGMLVNLLAEEPFSA